MVDLTNPIFTDADTAREHLEKVRWPDGPICPHCGVVDEATAMQGKSHRKGLHKCNACRKPFSVTVGTVFERSKVPLNKWLLATHLITSSKKGISAHQLHRSLGVTYKTAWFMAHRIREAMKPSDDTPMGGEGGAVEADETYFGSKNVIRKRTKRGKASHSSKRSVVALVERNGKARSFHVHRADQETVKGIVRKNVSREANLHTDESRLYNDMEGRFASHSRVKHSAGEYVRGDAYTNTVEGYFSIFKRGMKGVYQHCGEQHLHRYLAEFDFRYNSRIALGFNDTDRATSALKAIEGKRLTYRRTNEARA